MNRNKRSFLKDESGAVLLYWALLLPIVAGTSGLALDVGQWYNEARDIQTVGDAAALTAAYKTDEDSDADFVALVQREFVRAGYDLSDVIITTNTPPSRGPYVNDPTAIEVIASVRSKHQFSSLLLNSGGNITSRSVARRDPSAGNACILALDTNSPASIDVGGNAILNSGNCVMASNSNDPQSIDLGGSSTIVLDSMYTAGGIDDDGAANSITLNRPAQTYRSALKDPYADLDYPAPSATCAEDKINKKSPTTLSEGTFCNGLSLNAGENVTLNPGTYIIQGDLKINAQATLSGNGVTLILAAKNGSYGNVSINGNSSVNLTAKSTGDFKGVVLTQDRAAPESVTHTFNGGSGMTLKGALYFPSQEVKFNGNSEIAVNCLQLVGRTITFTGNSKFNDSCEDTGTREIPTVGNVVLAE